MISSIILALHLLGFISAANAASFLLVAGVLMIASEFLFTSGIVAFNGALALYIAYTLQYGRSEMFGISVDWPVLFGISFVELVALGTVVMLFLRLRRLKNSTGAEGMIGQNAEVVEWRGAKGRVHIQGETWRACTDRDLDLKKGDTVVVCSLENLTLKIKT